MALEDARRWLVIGNSGSGKSTLARRIGAALDLPHVELDGIQWQAGWTENPRFIEDVTALTEAGGWIVDGYYPAVRPLLTSRAEVLVWLDPPHPVILWRVTVRTIVRRLRRQELWNGNLEPPLRTFFTDDEHVIRWAAGTLREHEARVRAALAASPRLVLVRLRTGRDARRLLERLGRSIPPGGTTGQDPGRTSPDS